MMAELKKNIHPGTSRGNDHSLERLSSVTENYLLSLYRLWEDSETPTVTQLTDALKQLPPTEGLGTSVPSVSGMIRRMQKQGLVDLGGDKRIRLTKRGLAGGEDIARCARGFEPHSETAWSRLRSGVNRSGRKLLLDPG